MRIEIFLSTFLVPTIAVAMGDAMPQIPNENTSMSEHPLLAARNVNFTAAEIADLRLTPSCLKNAGVELVILDAGHDDSEDSTRSDAKIRGGNGRYVIQWPKVHEGKLNMLSSWLAFDALLKNPRLSVEEKNELRTMIRFSRLPGEKSFGQFEKAAGYAASTSGLIDSGVTNRSARIDYMMQHHRAYDPSRPQSWSAQAGDVSSKTVMISVHANSSDYYDEGDLTWVIPPKNTKTSSPLFQLLKHMANGLSGGMGEYFELKTGDDSTQSSLKRSVASTVELNRIKTDEHSVNLAVLNPNLGTSKTRKLLLEGFVMNGKAGHLANLDLTNQSMKLEFSRQGSVVANYDYADLYLAYGRSIARGLSEAFGCD